MSSNPARSFYDRISHVYDALADSSERAAREKGLELLAVESGERVLEIGYGTGHSLVELAQAVGPRGRVYGVDISQGMHDISLRRVEEAECADRVELCVAETPPLPYEDHAFDAVTTSFTLELFPPEQIPEVLREVRRVLGEDGRLGVVCMATTPSGKSDSFLERTYKWMHQHFPHIVDCAPIDGARFLEEAGFSIAERSDMEIWTMPVQILVGRASG